MPTKLAILLPVYNDEASLRKILADISRELGRQPGLKVFIINDGSPVDAWTLPNCPFPVEIIHLARNLGHQKAIAIGPPPPANRTDVALGYRREGGGPPTRKWPEYT